MKVFVWECSVVFCLTTLAVCAEKKLDPKDPKDPKSGKYAVIDAEKAPISFKLEGEYVGTIGTDKVGLRTYGWLRRNS